MEDSGTANTGSDADDPNDRTAGRDADGGRATRRGLARYARPALIAGIVLAVVCAALLVIIFFLDSFNATVYSVGGKDVADATDEARDIRDTYAAARTGGIVVLAAGVVLAAAGALVLYRHRGEAGASDADNGEDVNFEDLG
ncbi:hypothetical protein QK292_07145 [Arthrobacter sp. AL08]|uniref:hypothetical protein n=1 Tax=Micrococcaceae TaxID=1268 RepID=UPI001CFF8EDE|nr:MULTISPECIES: hypothetical protein [Micrococcaceae]MCB5281340.1 hypothetical protein [Arthrobacter sp. ES1]MDI3241389.1 hypothetical protein [Arthrobacter sp. AL05]MDI3277354.1 hypothetical protein [Arthrobacter sp. AL08]MDJ0352865.1 hypothetical protein [Pseudarthrobacter sp. PH31-O2]WGZ78617.1 hypothetical protein QI450_12135 [Arthrobacter sp. EM1]